MNGNEPRFYHYTNWNNSNEVLSLTARGRRTHKSPKNVRRSDLVYANYRSSQKPQFQVKKCSRDSWKILCYHQFTPIMLWSSAKTDLIHLLIHPIRSTPLLLPKILWDTLENNRISVKMDVFDRKWVFFYHKWTQFDHKRANFGRNCVNFDQNCINFDHTWTSLDQKWSNFDQKWPNFDRKHIEDRKSVV